MIEWPAAFAGTLAIELAIAWRLRPARGSRATFAWLATCACANALSHPLAWVAHASAGIAATELGVVALESAAYRGAAGVSWRRAIGVALVANAVSAASALA